MNGKAAAGGISLLTGIGMLAGSVATLIETASLVQDSRTVPAAVLGIALWAFGVRLVRMSAR